MDIIHNNSKLSRSLTDEDLSIILIVRIIPIASKCILSRITTDIFLDLPYLTHDCDSVKATAAANFENQATSSIRAFRACPA
jgi:hypothetical protein